MMNPLHLLKPREVRWTLKALDTAIWSSPGGLHDIREPISQRCRSQILDADRTCYSIRVDNHTPMSLAIMLAIDATEEILLSGNLHAYRGVLSGHGQAAKKLLNHLYSLQLGEGRISEAEIADRKIEISREIASVG